MVADEVDAADASILALVDLEHEIDPIFGELNDLGLDGRSEPAMPTIQIENARDIVLHSGSGVHDARTQLDLGREVLLVDLVVTLEGDPIDDRILDHPDDQGVPDSAKIHISKKPGGEQRLQRLVHQFIVPSVARLNQQIRANGLGLDPLRTLDPNIADRPAAHLGERRTANRCCLASR